jgi:hypothetical protein
MLGLLLCVVLALPAPAAATGDAAAKVVALRGEVTAHVPDAPPRVLRVGSPVAAGERVVTGTDAAVRLAFTDDTSLSLGARSEMTIEQYRARAGDDVFLLGVSRGIFRLVTGAIARARPQAVTVRIPVATIGIRGTHFGGEVHETSAVIVLLEPEDGRGAAIEVANAYGAVTIEEPGYGTEIPDAVSPPSPPRRMRLRAVDNLIRALSTIQRLQIPRAPMR